MTPPRSTTIEVAPFGYCKDLVKLQSGYLFDLYQGKLDGRPVCLKVPHSPPQVRPTETTPTEVPLYKYFEANINFGSEVYGDTSVVAPPGLWEISLLLQMEAEIIRATQGWWNHSAIGMGIFDSPDGDPIQVISRTRYAKNSKFWPVLLMPYHQAMPLSAYPQEEKCRLFPYMLLFLWDALCFQPHGDLSENNLLVEEDKGNFVLIDPGVCIGGLDCGKTLFTTNAVNYPLLFPHQHVNSGRRWFEDFTLLEIAEVRGFEERQPRHRGWLPGSGTTNALQPVKRKRPTAADLQALGLIYYRILSSGHNLPAPLGTVHEPAWFGSFSTPSRDAFQIDFSVVNTETIKVIEDAISAFKPKIRALVKALVLLEVKTRDQMEELVRNALPYR